jgi:DNA-directed RNA polymerase subunit RPC12/RpoP
LLQEVYSREDPCWFKQAAADAEGIVITTPIMASAIAAMQVEIGLRCHFSRPEDASMGSAWRLTLHPGPTLESATFERSSTCPLHEPTSVMRAVRELPHLRSADCSVARLFEELGVGEAVLRLDWPVTISASCSGCGHRWEPFVRRAAFRRIACPACGHRDIVELGVVTTVQRGSAGYERPLAMLGQPDAHIYEVLLNGGRDTVHVEITGDLAAAASLGEVSR